MLPIILLVLGSTAITLQDSIFKDSQKENETELAIPTTVQSTSLFTFETTRDGQAPQSEQRNSQPKQDGNSCKNQFLCPTEKKSFSSKAFPPVPSKDLVPPFTDSEEEGVRTTTEETSTTILSETETKKDQLIFKAPSVTIEKSSETEKQRNEDLIVKPEAANEVRSFLLPKKLLPVATQVDLSYLPPKSVVAAAASQSMSELSYIPPSDILPAAAQEDVTLLKPEDHSKDICSDAFHSFLCTPLKSRKRITGALPNSLTSKPSPLGSLNPAASNTIQSSLGKPKPSIEPENEAPSSYPPSTSTTAHYTPLPSDIDRSYLPPVSKSLFASPSFNSIKIANGIHGPTTHKSISTSTARPFDHTSILPYLSPKVIEHFSIGPSKLGGTVTTERPKPKSFTNRFFQESSNQFDKGRTFSVSPKQPTAFKTTPFATVMPRSKALAVQVFTEARKPPITTTTNSPRYGVSTANIDRSYLPPSSNLDSAAAVQVNQAVVAPAPVHHEKHHNHNHDHHHGKDICSDPFHSFLCTPLKQRKRITGAFPSNFNSFNSNNKGIKLKPNEGLKSENILYLERRLKPAANTVALRTAEQQSSHFALPPQSPPDRASVTTVRPNTGHQYRNIDKSMPLPSQQKLDVVVKEDKLAPVVVLSKAFKHPEPLIDLPLTSQKTFDRPKTESTYKYFKPSSPLPLSSQQEAELVPKEDRPKPSFLSPLDYRYQKPTVSFSLPSQTTTERVKLTTFKLTTGYQHHKSSNPLPLPSQQNVQVVAKEDRLSPKVVPFSGYQYPTPPVSFPLPSQTSTDRVRPTTAKPTTGYQYPKPSNPLPLPSQQNVQVVAKEDRLSPKVVPFSGYQYPKPPVSFPLPSQTSTDCVRPTTAKPTTGYQYPKPSNPLPLPSQQNVQIVAKEDRLSPKVVPSSGYQYPTPPVSFPLPSQTSTDRVRPTTAKPTTGYQYPKPSNPLPLPSQQNVQIVAKEDRLSPKVVPFSGYQYPKPPVSFPLPSQTSTDRVRPTTAKPTTGYQYPKPSNPLPLPTSEQTLIAKQDRLRPVVIPSSGYQYPKPAIPFLTPSEGKDQSLSTGNQRPVSQKPSPSPATGYSYPKPVKPFPLPSQGSSINQSYKSSQLYRNLGSAEFIPVNKIDLKRHAEGSSAGGLKFGDRIRNRKKFESLVSTLQ